MAKKQIKAKRAVKRTKTKEQVAADFITGLFGTFVSDILHGPTHEPWSRQKRRLRIGAAGGLFYAGIKGLIYDGISGLMMVFVPPEPGARWVDSIVGFSSAAITAALGGAVAAWITAQRSTSMIFIFGMLGLQFFITLFPGLQPKVTKTTFFIEQSISIRAFAAEQDSADKCVGDSAFEKGFKTFFGARPSYDKFAVVLASGKTRAEAQAKLKILAGEDPSLKLKLGPRACDNDFFPVFATDYLPQSEAKAALENLRKIRNDAYLSGGPRE